MIGVAEGFSRPGILRSHDADDTPGAGRVDPLPLVGMHLEDAGKLFLFVEIGVEHVLAGRELSAVDPRIGEFPALHHGDLEDQGPPGACSRGAGT